MVLSVIQSVLLYGCQVYHSDYSIPNYLSSCLERVQKRALKIIYGYDNHYRDALQMAGLKTLKDQREDPCLKILTALSPILWIFSITYCLLITVINSWNYGDADHLEFPLKQTHSEIRSFQQAQDILIDIYYNYIIM